MIANYKKKQTVTQLKKFYSAIYQSIEFSKMEYGNINDWDWTLDVNEFFEKYFAQNLKIIKKCANAAGCWHDNGIVHLLSGTNTDYVYRDHTSSALVLSDGTLVALRNDNSHMHLFVDINGEKSPNTYGKDIFVFTITSNGLYDSWHRISSEGLYMYGYGFTRDELKSDCSKNSRGLECGQLILMDGWQIKDDYPW